MERLDATAGRAVRQLLSGQPTSEAKVVFAWKIAAGPALSRAASVSWSSDGTLYVRAKSDTWRKELLRGRAIITERVHQLLGPDVVRQIKFPTVTD